MKSFELLSSEFFFIIVFPKGRLKSAYLPAAQNYIIKSLKHNLKSFRLNESFKPKKTGKYESNASELPTAQDNSMMRFF